MSTFGGSWWGDINSGPIIVAHRCGCGEAPENTSISCQQSIRAGSSIIQVEVMPAKDGTPIVAQSDDLLRLTGKDLKLSQLSVEEIPPLQQKISSYIPGLLPDLEIKNFSEEKISIPTLKKFLEAFIEADTEKKCGLFVEPFIFDVKFIAQVAQVINEVGIGERIIVGHPQKKMIQEKIIEIFPDSQILLTMTQCLWMGFLFRIGLLPPEKIPKNRVINIFYPVKGFLSGVKQIVPFFIFYMFLFFGFLAKLLIFQKDFVEYVQKNGCPITAYVVNGEEDWQKLSDLGVRGILTDYPSKCKQFFDKKNLDQNNIN